MTVIQSYHDAERHRSPEQLNPTPQPIVNRNQYLLCFRQRRRKSVTVSATRSGQDADIADRIRFVFEQEKEREREREERKIDVLFRAVE